MGSFYRMRGGRQCCHCISDGRDAMKMEKGALGMHLRALTCNLRVRIRAKIWQVIGVRDGPYRQRRRGARRRRVAHAQETKTKTKTMTSSL
jgi:hypothetical protein